jgi:CheY-like chemotaxis protein
MNNYMLVDDDETFLFLHDHMIKIADTLGEVSTMKSSPAAVQHINNLIRTGEKMPDCILVDLNMPEMSGFQFLEFCSPHMKGPMQHVHIYMVTSSLYETDRDRALSFSFIKGFKEKPLSKEVVNEITALLKEEARPQFKVD